MTEQEQNEIFKAHRLISLEAHVRRILFQLPEARDDDFVLVTEAFHSINPATYGLTLEEIRDRHCELSLPSFESITRARRKVQRKHPELAPSAVIYKQRKEQEERFRKNYGRKEEY